LKKANAARILVISNSENAEVRALKLSEKIRLLRERADMSREELALLAGVSFRTVIQWELGKITPDIDKIVLLSRIFEVSTEILLCDELGLDGNQTKKKGKITVNHSMAKAYLEAKYRYAELIALATLLFILAPAVLIILGSIPTIEERAASLIGIGAILFLFSAAIGIYVYAYNETKKYDFFIKEEIELDYGTADFIKRESEECKNGCTIQNILAIAVLIISFIPILVAARFFESNDKYMAIALVATLSLAGIGIVLFINSGIRRNALLALRETKKKKAENSKYLEALISRIIWTSAAVIYLMLGFSTKKWLLCILVFFFALCIKGLISVVFSIVRRDNDINID